MRNQVISRLWGAGALLGTLLALVGVPIVLLAIWGSPIPMELPDPGQVAGTLSSRDDGSLLLGILGYAAWMGWGFFAYGLAAEAVSFRSRSALRPVHSMSPRGVARALVATMALLVVPIVPLSGAALADSPDSPVRVVSSDHRSAGIVSADSSTRASGAVQTTQTTAGSQADSEIRPNETGLPPLAAELAQPTTATPGEYVVESGDTLWDISQDQLGDGEQYRQIFEASESRVQPGGGRLVDPDHIETGWHLVVPQTTDPTANEPAPVQPPAAAEAEPEVGVETEPEAGSGSPTGADGRPGDVGGAADGERESGPSESVDSPDEEQSGQAGAEVGSDAGADAASEATGAGAGAGDNAASEGDSEQGAGVPAAQGDGEAGAGEAGGAVGQEAADSEDAGLMAVPDDSDSGSDSGGWPVRTAAGLGSLLAAALLAVLGARLLRQRRDRRFGELLPLPPIREEASDETLRQISDPLGMRRVDMALRGLARDFDASGRILPSVRLARLSEFQFELMLAEPAELPAPWSGSSDGTVWVFAAGPDSSGESEQVDGRAPYPGLVTLGHIDTPGQEAHLMVDLQYVTALGILGKENRVSGVIRALTLELATSIWADDLQVSTLGILHDLESALQSGRVQSFSDCSRYLERLERRAGREESSSNLELESPMGLPVLTGDDQEAAESEGSGFPREAPTSRPASSGFSTLEVVVAGDPLGSADRIKLGEVLSDVGTSNVASITAQDSLGEWHLEFVDEESERAVLQPLGISLVPQSVSDAAYQGILGSFRLAQRIPQSSDDSVGAKPELTFAELSRTAGEPVFGKTSIDILADLGDGADPWQSDLLLVGAAGGVSETELTSDVGREWDGDRQASGPNQTEADAGMGEPPSVRLLGPPDIQGAQGPVESSKRMRCLEIVSYLAVHRDASADEFAAAIWPPVGRPVPQHLRDALVSRARRWLGHDSEGEAWLIMGTEGRLSLDPRVGTDVEEFCSLLPNGPIAASDDDLMAAARCIRGRPLEGTPTRAFAWAATMSGELVPAVTDMLRELGTRLLTRAAWADANAVAALGIRADGLCEPLWRIQVLARFFGGDAATANHLVSELFDLLADNGLEPEDATLQLVDRIGDGDMDLGAAIAVPDSREPVEV